MSAAPGVRRLRRLGGGFAHPGAARPAGLVLLGLLLGLLSTPPGPLPLLVLVADVPFLWLLGGGSRGRWKRWTWLYGALHVALQLRWLGAIHPAQVLGVACVLSVGWLLAAALIRLLVLRGLPWLLVVPVVLVHEEVFRTWWFGGMPWPARSLAVPAFPPFLADALVPSAAFAGAYALSFLAALASAALARLLPAALPFPPPARSAWPGLLAPGLLLLALVAAGTWRVGDVEGRRAAGLLAHSGSRHLVAVQGAIPQDLKHSLAGDAPMHIFRTHLELTRAALAAEREEGRAPLAVLWPETMVPWPFVSSELAPAFRAEYENMLRVLGHVRVLAEQHGGSLPFLLGIVWQFRRGEEVHQHLFQYGTYDSLLLVDPASVPSPDEAPPAPPPPGEIYAWATARHDKHVLVPGGEYTPLGEVLVPLRAFRQLVAMIPELDAGAEGQDPFPLATLQRPSGPLVVEAGTVICFELLFPARCRAWRARGAHVLVNAANYGWFGASGFRAQVRAAAALRAAETGASVVMAGNTGPTAFWDPLGRPYGAFRDLGGGLAPAGGDATTFREGWASAPLVADPVPTPYVALGDVPLFALGILVLLGATLPWHARDERDRTGPRAGAAEGPGEGEKR